MSTNFPTSLDTWPTLTDNQTTIVAQYINDIQDAVEALEAKVGIDSSADGTSLDYKIRNFFDRYTPRKIYLYEDTAPTRWSTVSATSDKMIAVKGGSEYSTGGDTAGDWAITGWDDDTHLHQTWYFSGGYAYTYNSGGSAFTMTSQAQAPEDRVGLSVGLTWDNLSCGYPDWYYYFVQINSGTYAYTAEDTHSHSHSGTWRPAGAVGIMVKYDG